MISVVINKYLPGVGSNLRCWRMCKGGMKWELREERRSLINYECEW